MYIIVYMQNITIVLKTKKLDEETLKAILQRVLRELEKEGMKKAVKSVKITVEE